MDVQVIAKPKSDNIYPESNSPQCQTYSFSLKDIPLVLAILLRGEPHVHSSLKSTFSCDKDDAAFDCKMFNRWVDLSKTLLEHQCPEMDDTAIQEKAAQIAGHMISVSTEAYAMSYTATAAQISIFITCAQNFIHNRRKAYPSMPAEFYATTVRILKDFLPMIMSAGDFPKIDDDQLFFSLFSLRNQQEKGKRISCGGFEWTFTKFLERQEEDKSLQIDFYENQFPIFHIPNILGKASTDCYIDWWIEDMSKLLKQGGFPQGCVIKVLKID